MSLRRLGNGSPLLKERRQRRFVITFSENNKNPPSEMRGKTRQRICEKTTTRLNGKTRFDSQEHQPFLILTQSLSQLFGLFNNANKLCSSYRKQHVLIKQIVRKYPLEIQIKLLSKQVWRVASSFPSQMMILAPEFGDYFFGHAFISRKRGPFFRTRQIKSSWH